MRGTGTFFALRRGKIPYVIQTINRPSIQSGSKKSMDTLATATNALSNKSSHSCCGTGYSKDCSSFSDSFCFSLRGHINVPSIRDAIESKFRLMTLFLKLVLLSFEIRAEEIFLSSCCLLFMWIRIVLSSAVLLVVCRQWMQSFTIFLVCNTDEIALYCEFEVYLTTNGWCVLPTTKKWDSRSMDFQTFFYYAKDTKQKDFTKFSGDI